MSQIGLLRTPETIILGYGARHELPAQTSSIGRKVFVVVDPALAKTRSFTATIESLLGAGLQIDVSSDLDQELSVGKLRDLSSRATDFSPQVIIGWGGGTAIDAAKIVALLVSYPDELSNYYGENLVPGPVVPIIAVPTTAGTGSEVTPVAVVSDSSRELKVGISSPHLIPKSAVVDPELTLGAPTKVTAYAGIDALVHAVESYTAAELNPEFGDTLPVFVGRNDLSAPLSLEAIHLIGASLETAVSTPDDRAARKTMAQGSLLAGIAFGSTGTHLSHAIQYPLGAYTKTPHGLGTGLLVPYVLEACSHVIADQLADVGRALGVGADPNAAVDRVAQITKNIGIPGSLSEIGVHRSDIPRIAELSLLSARLTSIAPMVVDTALITRILNAAFMGDRSLAKHA